MPLYEYECENCGHVFEQRHGMNEAPVSSCPACNGTVSQEAVPSKLREEPVAAGISDVKNRRAKADFAPLFLTYR